MPQVPQEASVKRQTHKKKPQFDAPIAQSQRHKRNARAGERQRKKEKTIHRRPHERGKSRGKPPRRPTPKPIENGDVQELTHQKSNARGRRNPQTGEDNERKPDATCESPIDDSAGCHGAQDSIRQIGDEKNKRVGKSSQVRKALTGNRTR